MFRILFVLFTCTNFICLYSEDNSKDENDKNKEIAEFHMDANDESKDLDLTEGEKNEMMETYWNEISNYDHFNH